MKTIYTTQNGLENMRRINTVGNFMFKDAGDVIAGHKKCYISNGWLIWETWPDFLLKIRCFGGFVTYNNAIVSAANEEDMVWMFQPVEDEKSIKCQLAKVKVGIDAEEFHEN
jgi:hypothetical protein